VVPTDTVLLAHQGGWDEIGLLLGPIVLIGVLVYVARRGAAAAPPDEDDQPDDPDRS
jgi:hypothetical protein